MRNISKTGAYAAFANALLGAIMLFTVLVLIGPAALSDRAEFIKMALNNPGPLLLQDILKFFSAVTTFLILQAISGRLQSANPALVRTGSFFGLLSIILLLANACISLYSTTQASNLEESTGIQLNLTIGLFGLGSIALNGIWYLLENWVARKSKLLPAGLATLGLVIGAISLVPPLAIFVLLLSMIWSVWLGRVLLKND